MTPSSGKTGRRLDALPPALIRLVVAGSRTYNNTAEFSRFVREYLCRLGVTPESDIVFISGKARKGPDNMIIDWCRDNGYNWVEYPAEWKKDGQVNMGAGYERNIQMANVATHALIFWDGMSKGTMHMHSACMRRYKNKEMAEKPFLIHVEPDPIPEYENLFWS